MLLCVTVGAADIYRVAPTGSMRPLFDETCVLYVEAKPWADIRPGDIIIYRTAFPCVFNGVVYHAIVHTVWQRSSNGGILLCWGINNPAPDAEFITKDMYVGTVVKWQTIEEYLK